MFEASKELDIMAITGFDIARKIMRNVPNWHPFKMSAAFNGVLVEGGIYPEVYSKGPRKGTPHWGKPDLTNDRWDCQYVLVTDAMLRAAGEEVKNSRTVKAAISV